MSFEKTPNENSEQMCQLTTEAPSTTTSKRVMMCYLLALLTTRPEMLPTTNRPSAIVLAELINKVQREMMVLLASSISEDRCFNPDQLIFVP